jgi:hypothetical protein
MQHTLVTRHLPSRGFFLVIQITFVSLRGGTKWLIKGIWGYDDLLVLGSLLLQIGLVAIAFGMLVSSSLVI